MTHPTVSYEEALALQPLVEGRRPEILSPILAAAAEVLQANGHIDLCCRSEDDETEVWTADRREENRALTHPTLSPEEALALKPLIVGKNPEALSPVLTEAAQMLEGAGAIELLSWRDRPSAPETKVWDDTGTWTPYGEAALQEARALTERAVEATTRLTRLWGYGCGSSHGAFRVLQMAHLGNGRVSIDDLLRFDADNRAAAIDLLAYALKFGTENMPISEGLRTALINEQIRVGKLRGFQR